LIVLYITFLVILVLIIEPEFSRVYRYYLVEENQMSMIEGIFVRKKLSIPYEKITDTSVSKTFFGRILNYGDITVSGIRNDITMRGVRDPYKIYHEIQGRIAASRKTKPTKKT
jgi:membrane protein YdbS with pleckstrin-like domain